MNPMTRYALPLFCILVAAGTLAAQSDDIKVRLQKIAEPAIDMRFTLAFNRQNRYNRRGIGIGSRFVRC
jgi:hypothetical protein